MQLTMDFLHLISIQLLASVETVLFMGYNYGLYTILGQTGVITPEAGFKLTAKVVIM